MSGPSRHSVSVAAVVADDAERVLVVQRRDNGNWELPGGVLELNESVHVGLRREVREETGIGVEPERLTGIYKNLTLGVVALVFRAERGWGRPRPTTESRGVEWWTLAAVRERMAEVYAVRILDAFEIGAPAIRLHDGVNLIVEPPPWGIPTGIPKYEPGSAPPNLLTDWQLGQRGMNPGAEPRGWLLLADGAGMALYDIAEARPR